MIRHKKSIQLGLGFEGSAILFTSDVSARGVDYLGVSQVIQFGMPDNREQYVHRLGRTGRGGATGKGWLVLGPFESLFLQELKGVNIPRNDELLDLLESPMEPKTDEMFTDATDKIRNSKKRQASAKGLTSILLSTKRKEDTKREKKVANVVFLHYNKEEEEERQERGRKLRTRLKYEKALGKLYKEEAMAQNNTHNRVYAALIDPANVVLLNTFATHNRPFQDELFAVFRDINMANPGIFPNPQDALGVLHALIAVNLPYLNISIIPFVRDRLGMIGSLEGFRPFLVPHISDGSDDDKNDGGDDDKNGGDNNKKGGDDDTGIGRGKRQRISS